MTIKNVTVAGGGVLGSQIAYQSALKGFNVTLYDINDEQIANAKQHVNSLQSGYQRDIGLTPEEFQTGLSNMTFSAQLSEAVKDTDLVIEAIPEKLEIKQNFYKQLSEVAPEETIFASNSSTLIPSAMVKFTDRPKKFLNLHFANKIWAFNTAEVMGTPETDPDVESQVVEFAKQIGMVPIVLHKEQPGYIVNSLLVPFAISSLKLWAAGIADPESIDKTWMISQGATMGPFMTIDMIGLVTPYNVGLEYLKTNNDPVSELAMKKLKEMIDAGKTGRQAGEGFYTYPNPDFEKPDFLKA